jgi:MerR family copper efflux transcriptional regulator
MTKPTVWLSQLIAPEPSEGACMTSDRTGHCQHCIGEVAERAKVHIETLRYYEQRRLIASPPRSISNYRLYTEHAVRRVRFIKRAQELGFSLKEIRELLYLRAASEVECGEIRAHADATIKDIEEKIGSLMAMKSALEAGD